MLNINDHESQFDTAVRLKKMIANNDFSDDFDPNILIDNHGGYWGNNSGEYMIFCKLRMECMDHIIRNRPELINKIVNSVSTSYSSFPMNNCNMFIAMLGECSGIEMISSPDNAKDYIVNIYDHLDEKYRYDYLVTIFPYALSCCHSEIIDFIADAQGTNLTYVLDHSQAYRLMESGCISSLKKLLMSAGKNTVMEHMKDCPDYSLSVEPEKMIEFLYNYMGIIADLFYPHEDRKQIINDLFNELNLFESIFVRTYTNETIEDYTELLHILNGYGITIRNISTIGSLLSFFFENNDRTDECREFITSELIPIMEDKAYIISTALSQYVFHNNERFADKPFSLMREIYGNDRITVCLFYDERMSTPIFSSDKVFSFLLNFNNIIWEGPVLSDDEFFTDWFISDKNKLLPKLLKRKIFTPEQLNEILTAAIEKKQYKILNLIYKNSNK